MPPTPETLARQNIDNQLTACGWMVQDRAGMNLYAGRGVAVREFPLQTGFADYLLFVDRKAIGVIEAKQEGSTLSHVADQAARYSVGLPANIPHVTLPLPFLYESTGVETFFRDERVRAPFPEQQRIVAKIEELFTQLEAGTAALKRVRAGLKRYKASVLKAPVGARRRSSACGQG